MKIGTLCYATDSGLGILSKAFFDHGIVTHPIVVRHGRHQTHDEWYPGCPQIGDLKSPKQISAIKSYIIDQRIDLMLFFETPFLWDLIPFCQRNEIKTVLVPMYECMPEKLPYPPDAFINPSLLDQRYYPSGQFLPIPVDTKLIQWKQRNRAEVFVHNAGHGGLKGRNGTIEFCEALRLVRSKAKFILRMQGPQVNLSILAGLADRVKIERNTVPFSSLYSEGDVFLFPEKFNGLSLPLQEARASGMLVMCGKRFPMNTWLPSAPLIPVKGYRTNRIGPPYNQFEEAIFDPQGIAAMVDEWYGADISEYSLSGKEWAEMHSWEGLGPVWKQELERMVG